MSLAVEKNHSADTLVNGTPRDPRLSRCKGNVHPVMRHIFLISLY